MQRLGFEKLRQRDAVDRARRRNGDPMQPLNLPPKVVAARKRLEDLALAREVGVPVEEIL